MVAETDHYAIVDKPALLDSQNSRADRPSVVTWLFKQYGFKGLVHRLDFGTSGLMVCAKNAAAAKMLTRQLQDGKIKRVYIAVAMGKIIPDQGAWTEPLDEQQACSRYRVLERYNNATLVEVTLGTGRKHQIRRHFAQAHHPLLGDQLYGRAGSQRLFNRPALHAARLTVEGHQYQAELPIDLRNLITRLKTATRS